MRAGSITFGKFFPTALHTNGQYEFEEIKISLFLDPGETADDALAKAEKWVTQNIKRRREIIPESENE